jgi:hypothetical protein
MAVIVLEAQADSGCQGKSPHFFNTDTTDRRLTGNLVL